MTSLAEIDLVAAVTAPLPAGAKEPLPTEALVDYLRGTGPVTSLLRDVLADLLDENSNHALRLRLGKRDNRRLLSEIEVARGEAAFKRVTELTQALVTEELCESIHAALNGWHIKRSNTDVHLQQDGVTKIRLRLGKRLSHNLAIEIAAFEHNKSYETLRKLVSRTQAAIDLG